MMSSATIFGGSGRSLSRRELKKMFLSSVECRVRLVRKSAIAPMSLFIHTCWETASADGRT